MKVLIELEKFEQLTRATWFFVLSSHHPLIRGIYINPLFLGIPHLPLPNYTISVYTA